MFKTFYPDEYVASTYVLDFEKMYREGCRGLVFDIDNTLVPHGAPADERAICLFDRLRSIGFPWGWRERGLLIGRARWRQARTRYNQFG